MKHHHQQMLPVWFFIGALLLVYGIIIFTVGVVDYSHPAPVVLANDHLNLWGGIILILLGGFYTIRFRPHKSRERLRRFLFSSVSARTDS